MPIVLGDIHAYKECFLSCVELRIKASQPYVAVTGVPPSVMISVRLMHHYFRATLTRFGRSVGTYFGSYYDVLKELWAENYTIGIAASRSF